MHLHPEIRGSGTACGRTGRLARSQAGEHMTYAIIGFGKIGQALARAFARKGVEVMVASRRPPEALAD